MKSKKNSAGWLVACALSATFAAGAAETWRMTEISFESAGRAGEAVEMDVAFSDGASTLVRPAFWDGGRTYRVRFAAPSAGTWTWRSACAAEPSLDGKTGALEVIPHAGDLAVYRHGFVRAPLGKKHFVHADGKPFLYLGDTHWGFGREVEEDATNAAVRHVETVARRRVEQGFTVWQSEPIGCAFDLADGRVDEQDLPGLRRLDRGFRTVADAGLVHANAQFFFPTQLKEPLASDTNALRRLARHWVARFGAYPVMWTLGQEVDDDMYYGRQNKSWTAARNPYLVIARFLHAFDAYGHPLTAHQENTGSTTVTGAGASSAARTNGVARGRSIFADPEAAAACGHNWWGAQWSPKLDGAQNADVVRDYWNDRRTAVNYEGRYCGLWAMDFGARAQTWISFLSGFRGHGYGAADLWLYRSTYDMAKPSDNEVEHVSLADKRTPWREALEFPSANQMRHFRAFMDRLPWWELVPDFGESAAFGEADGLNGAWASARKGRDLVVAYAFGRRTARVGTVRGLEPGTAYALARFDPRTGAETDLGRAVATAAGEVALPPRPDVQDWVYRVARAEPSAAPARATEALLRFGVTADVHLLAGDTPRSDALKKAFACFDARRADGVVVCGDLTQNGKISELRRFGELWDAAFPGGRRSDGEPIEKLFAFGDHDVEPEFWPHVVEHRRIYGKFPKEFDASDDIALNDRARQWRAAFHEPFAPIARKRVKGFDFVLAHLVNRDEDGLRYADRLHVPGLEEFFATNAFDRVRPFFYVQHKIPRGTVGGPTQTGQDAGRTTAVLARHPNAVAFNGHKHRSAAEELSLWQGAFTAVQAPALCTLLTAAGRENGRCSCDAPMNVPAQQMPPLATVRDAAQVLFVTVYADRLVIERLDVVDAPEPVAEPWVVKWPADGSAAYAVRGLNRPAPQFAAGARVTATRLAGKNRAGETLDQVEVRFPLAASSDGTPRAYEYEVTATLAKGAVRRIVSQKRMYSPNCHRPERHEPGEATCVFGRFEIPADHDSVTFTVRPLDAWGRAGSPLATEPAAFWPVGPQYPF